MGSGRWSSATYAGSTGAALRAGKDVFTNSLNTLAQPRAEWKAHPDLDPMNIGMRESRDSVEHPQSVAISVLFDVTGSMAEVPQRLVKRLPELFQLLLLNGYVTDPQVLMGAIGDAFSDRVPVQVGQFESDNRIDDDLTNIVLERGGGGSAEESYDLGLYFAARHTSTDCVEKRDHKGYLFLIGDEKPYREVRPDVVQQVFGDTIPGPITIEDVLAEAEQKFHVFFILPGGTHYWDRQEHADRWQALVGANFLKVEDPDAIIEVIGVAIGVLEGNVTVDDAVDHIRARGDDGIADTVRDVLKGLNVPPGGTVRV